MKKPNRYLPHQGKRECARRIRQLERLTAKELPVVLVGAWEKQLVMDRQPTDAELTDILQSF